MVAELRTLLWLQWRLTVSIFRRRSTVEGWSRLLGLGLKLVQLVFTFPLFLAMGIALAVGMAILSADAAFELAMIVNTGMVFVWLLLPSSYSQQMVERFEMSRLFTHPISFRGIIVGSTLIATLSMTGLWTVPMLLGEIVGLGWHAPLSLPLILAGALPTFVMMALLARIMEDFFDLVAGDRRLRALLLFLLMSPFVGLYGLQYYLQFTTDNFTRLPSLLERVIGPATQQALRAVQGPSGFLETLRLSRLLIWLPPGWATAAMGSAGRGKWGEAVLFLILSVAFVGGLLWVHAGITRRLMDGSILTIGTERVRARRLGLRLPGPPLFWALFRKDWIYLFRSPLTRRLLLVAPMAVIGMIPAVQGLGQEADPFVASITPMLVSAFIIVLLSMVFNMGLTSDYYGAIDREGFATLALSPLDRRYIIATGNLAVALFSVACYLILMFVVATISGQWVVLFLGGYLGICLQVGCAPGYNLAAILGPFRAQLNWQGRQRGSAWGLVGLLPSLPILALFLLPYVYWKPGLILTLPLAAVYSVGVYALSLKPLARLLQWREFEILQAVTKEQ